MEECENEFSEGEEEISDTLVFSRDQQENIESRGNKDELIDRIMTNGEDDENGLNDSKLFNIITSKPQNIDVATRSRSGVEKLYPAAVSDYRNNMGFVDRNNKNTQMYSHSHKSYKWWFSIFNYLLRMFILNGYLMHKKNDPIDYLKYLQELCKNIVSNISLRNRILIPKDTRGERFIYHPIKYLSASKKCQCKPNCKIQTRYECQQCDISINPICFEIYHKLT
ncbi:hypothetical protein ACTFIY_009520 [Dictyostelium cf. discoideum]